MVKELNLMNISSLNISMNAMACLVELINCESRELSAVESRGESCGLRVDIRRSAREPAGSEESQHNSVTLTVTAAGDDGELCDARSHLHHPLPANLHQPRRHLRQPRVA